MRRTNEFWFRLNQFLLFSLSSVFVSNSLLSRLRQLFTAVRRSCCHSTASRRCRLSWVRAQHFHPIIVNFLSLLSFFDDLLASEVFRFIFISIPSPARRVLCFCYCVNMVRMERESFDVPWHTHKSDWRGSYKRHTTTMSCDYRESLQSSSLA